MMDIVNLRQKKRGNGRHFVSKWRPFYIFKLYLSHKNIKKEANYMYIKFCVYISNGY